MHKFVHNMMHYAISGIHESRKNCFRKSSSLYHVYLSISPWKLPYNFAQKLRALATFRKSLTIFTFFSCEKCKTYSFVLCFVKKRICLRGWRWNVNYTCSSSTKFSTWRESTTTTTTTKNLNFFMSLTFHTATHVCKSHCECLNYSGMSSLASQFFFFCLSFPFRFHGYVSRLLRHGERTQNPGRSESVFSILPDVKHS